MGIKSNMESSTLIYNETNLDQSLQRAYDQLSLAVDATGIGFWNRNIQTNEFDCDDQWLKMLGYEHEGFDHTCSFWEECIHPEDRIKVLKALDNYINSKASNYKTEYRLRTKSGGYIWISDSGHIIECDSKNKPLRLEGISVEITEKIIYKERIRESEEKYKSILDHLNDSFCRFDFTGQILEVNKNLCDLLHIKYNDLIHNNVKFFFNNKALKYLHRRLVRIIEDKSVSFEAEIITPHRKSLPISISARLITTDGNGEIQALIRDIAERKISERALLDEKQKFKALIEHSPNVISRFGRNLKYQYASPNMLKIMGIPSEECIGKRLGETSFPEGLARHLEEKMKWVIRRNKKLSVSFSFDSPLGLKHFDATLVPETNNSNSVESILLTSADITEKVNHERELNYSKKQLEEAEKNVHFGIYEIDVVTGMIKWSNETYSIFERDAQLPPPNLEEYYYVYVHPDDFKLVKDHMDLSIIDLSYFNLSYRIHTSSGKIKYVNSTARIETCPVTGKALKMHGTIMDITEKNQIENRLFSERDILQIIMDNVPDAIYFKDNQCRYIRANRGYAKLFGFNSPEELIGKTVYDHLSKEIADEFNEHEQAIFASGIPLLNREKEIRTPYGKIWLSTTIVGIKDLSDQVTQLVGISRDITQYKLSEEQLLKAKEKAEEADKLKSTFLANMSHEIRTPINGILGFANLMEIREFPRDKEIQYLQIINNSGKHLLSLINDIIDIAKMEAGQINLNYSNVDLHVLFTDLLNFYQGEKNRRDKHLVDISVVHPPENMLQRIFTDPFRLRQVISNLISNSLKFTECGSIQFGFIPEENHVLFFVKDTGVGMSEEDLSVIFERFKQAGCPSKKKEGTGLGLAISKGLVELLGGKIWVMAQPGIGSEFYFSIPLIQTEQSTPEPFNTKPVQLKEYKWKGKTLLLVEDEEVNYLYVKELLGNTGITILHTITAEEAIKICKTSQPIDIILMDMRLPGINGFDATRLIKRIRQKTPIVAQTAYAMENERQKCIDAGCDHYLTKPFDQEVLFSVIDDFLQYFN
jgi:PAS domain S-box-containing protein